MVPFLYLLLLTLQTPDGILSQSPQYQYLSPQQTVGAGIVVAGVALALIFACGVSYWLTYREKLSHHRRMTLIERAAVYSQSSGVPVVIPISNETTSIDSSLEDGSDSGQFSHNRRRSSIKVSKHLLLWRRKVKNVIAKLKNNETIFEQDSEADVGSNKDFQRLSPEPAHVAERESQRSMKRGISKKADSKSLLKLPQNKFATKSNHSYVSRNGSQPSVKRLSSYGGTKIRKSNHSYVLTDSRQPSINRLSSYVETKATKSNHSYVSRDGSQVGGGYIVESQIEAFIDGAESVLQPESIIATTSRRGSGSIFQVRSNAQSSINRLSSYDGTKATRGEDSLAADTNLQPTPTKGLERSSLLQSTQTKNKESSTIKSVRDDNSRQAATTRKKEKSAKAGNQSKVKLGKTKPAKQGGKSKKKVQSAKALRSNTMGKVEKSKLIN